MHKKYRKSGLARNVTLQLPAVVRQLTPDQLKEKLASSPKPIKKQKRVYNKIQAPALKFF
jgi:hypothetical protein